MKILTKINSFAFTFAITLGFALGAQAETTYDYTIVLTNGVAYKSTDNGLTTGEPVSLDGLSYAGGVWTMKDFSFKTTAKKAMSIKGSSETTITVTGKNSISAGSSKDPVQGLDVAAATSIQGDGSLDIASGASKYSDCNGVWVGANLSIRGITLTANGGTAEFQNSTGMYVVKNQTLTVSDATVTLIGGIAVARSCGLRISGNTIVSGTGKIVATAGVGSTAYGVHGSNEPQATAKDESGSELTWDSTATTYKDAAGNIATNVTLTAKAPPVQIPSKPTEIANTTYAVYTNGVLSAEVGPGVWTVWSNGVATVVYTAKAGWCFETGAMEATNQLDTSVSPAVNKAGEVVPKLVQPVVMLGKIAQRYPWNGMLDIQYKTLYAGASCKVTFFADGKELGTAPGTDGKSATASFDLNTVAGGAFKGKTLKGILITATIE